MTAAGFTRMLGGVNRLPPAVNEVDGLRNEVLPLLGLDDRNDGRARESLLNLAERRRQQEAFDDEKRVLSRVSRDELDKVLDPRLDRRTTVVASQYRLEMLRYDLFKSRQVQGQEAFSHEVHVDIVEGDHSVTVLFAQRRGQMAFPVAGITKHQHHTTGPGDCFSRAWHVDLRTLPLVPA